MKMTGKCKLTYSAILKKLGTHWNWAKFESDARVTMTYNRFKEIMMTDEATEPIMTYERTVKTKFRELMEYGFLIKINQYSGFWNIDKVKQQVGLLSKEECKETNYPSDDISSPECPPEKGSFSHSTGSQTEMILEGGSE